MSQQSRGVPILGLFPLRSIQCIEHFLLAVMQAVSAMDYQLQKLTCSSPWDRTPPYSSFFTCGLVMVMIKIWIYATAVSLSLCFSFFFF